MPPNGIAPTTGSTPGLRELLLGFVGNLDFGGAGVFDVRGHGAINVRDAVTGSDFSLDMHFVFGHAAILDPKLNRTLGVGDLGRLLSLSAASAEQEHFFGGVLS